MFGNPLAHVSPVAPDVTDAKCTKCAVSEPILSLVIEEAVKTPIALLLSIKRYWLV
jgi:hypothetical protein